VTVDGAAHLAAAARAEGAAFVHLSTDMVFDGNAGPYDEDAPTSPLTPYGAAKAEAERAVRAAHPGAILARLPLLYSISPLDRGLAHWLTCCREGRGYPLFVDELRCPAHASDAARSLLLLVRALAGEVTLPVPPPIIHLPGPRTISRFEFGRLALAALDQPAEWAIPGRSADANPPRPRELVLVARRTPALYLAPLRPPEVALFAPSLFSRPPVPPPTPPTPPEGR